MVSTAGSYPQIISDPGPFQSREPIKFSALDGIAAELKVGSRAHSLNPGKNSAIVKG
jgi:hypothetical protein